MRLLFLYLDELLFLKDNKWGDKKLSLFLYFVLIVDGRLREF